MITYLRTNIFESNAHVLVNTVNTIGVMGKGLAKEFKRLYPNMFDSYQKYCESGHLRTGKLQLFRTKNKWILNFPTKQNWRDSSKLEYIESGLQKFVDSYEKQGVKSISFPMLGCGNGGLDWEMQVKPLMEKYLKKLPIEIFIHIGKADALKPEHSNQKEIDSWLKSEAKYLSSIEFFTHLKQRYSGLLNTVDEQNIKFEVTQIRIEDEEAFCLEANGVNLCLTESTLNLIWRTLKINGVLQAKVLSSELAQHSDMVMVFLSQLDYITLTELGDTTTQMAIRLLSHKQPVVISDESLLFVA